MGKKLGAGCALTIVGIAVVVGIIFWATAGPVAVADQFIEHIHQGQFSEAYDLLGPEVTKELPKEKFEDFLDQTQLREAQSGSWSNRAINNGEGTVKGEVNLSTGDSVTLNLFLIKVKGDWKINGLDLPNISSSPPPSTSIPSAQEKSAVAFFELLKAKDYAQAYERCGAMLKKDVDLAGFEELVKKAGLDSFKNLSWAESVASQTGRDLSGTLTLSNDNKLDIELVFQDVEGEWLIQGLNYRSQAQGSLDKPDHESASILAQGILKNLGVYVDQGNIEPLASLCDAGFADKLRDKNVVDPFLKKFGEPARLFSLLNEAIVFTAEPNIENSGALVLRGRTKLNDKKEYLHFELLYIPQQKRWALEKMDLWIRGPEDLAPEAEVSF